MLSPGKLLSVPSVTLWLISCFVTQAHAGPTYPQWWIDHGVIENDVLPPAAPGETGYDQATYDAWMAENYKAALLGQAKNLAKAAFNEMETAQAGSAGTEIANMVNGFSTAYEDNYTPILLGQLKEMVRPFYQVMDDANFTITLSDGTVISNQSYRFPWPEPPLLPSDPAYDPGNPTHVSAYEAWLPQHYQAALLGQVKHLFSFDLTDWPPLGDADGDGLPDDWEALIIAAGLTDLNGDGVIDIIDVLPGDDFDGDGHDNLFEYTWGTDGVVAGTDTTSGFADNFQAYPNNLFDGSKGWLTTGGPTVSIDTLNGANGTAMSLSVVAPNPAVPFSLYNEFDNSLGNEVWIEIYIKSVAGKSEPEINLSDAALLHFTDSGQLQVFNGYKTSSTTIDGGRWMDFQHAGTTTEVWNRITVRLDFSTLTWDVHLNGEFVAANLGFADAVPQFFKIAFSGIADEAFSIDEVLVQGDTSGIALDDIDGDGIVTYDSDPMIDSEDDNNDGNFDTDDTETDFAAYDTDNDRLSDFLEVTEASIAAANDFSNTGTYVRAPYTTGFEVTDDASGSNYTEAIELDGQNDWAVSPASQSARITVEGTSLSEAGHYSENAVVILDDNSTPTLTAGDILTIQRNIASYGSDKIWISFWGKLQGYTLPTTLTTEQQAREYLFMLNSSGNLSWYDPSISDWQTDVSLGNLEDTWHRYDIALNYQTRLWSISVDGVEVQADIPFIDPTRRSLEAFVYDQYMSAAAQTSSIDHLQVLKFRPLPLDADYDGMLDLWELKHFASRSEDADGDYDHDGRSNLAEYTNGWNPTDADEDADDIPDGVTPVHSPVVLNAIPYSTDFETTDGYSVGAVTDGTQDWYLDGSATASIQTGTVNAGSQALSLTSTTDQLGALVRYFDSGNTDPMWVDFYLNPVLADRPDTLTPSADNPASFYFNANGVLQYYDWDSAAWFSAGNDPITVNTWQRITIYLDFNTQEWSLYLNGTRILTEVDFSSPAPFFYSFVYEVYGTGTDYLDDLSVDTTLDQFFFDDDGDGIVNIGEDINGNGVLDAGEDANSNGILDLGEDANNNGIVDAGETDPLNWDTDGDFISDGEELTPLEVAAGADPLDATRTGTYAPIPILYDFDLPGDYAVGALNDQDYWIASDATIVSGTAHAADQLISLNYTTAADNIASIVRKLAPSQLGKNLYLTFDAKLQPGQLFDVAALTLNYSAEQANTLFTLDANGQLAVYDYDHNLQSWGWVTDTEGPSYADAWHTYQIGVDSSSDDWSLTVDGVTRFEGIELRDTSIPLPTYWSFHFQGLNPGDTDQSVLIDNITIAHDQDWDNAPVLSLPWADSFVGYNFSASPGSGEWTYSGAGASASINSTTVSDNDGASLSLTAGAGEAIVISHPVLLTDDDYLTIEFAVQPVLLGTAPSVDTGQPFDFYFGSTGKLHVSNGTSWVEVPGQTFSAGNWYQLRFALDLVNRVYRLDVERRFALEGLAFAGDTTEYTEFRLVHRSTTALLIDALTIDEGIPGKIVFDGVAEDGQTLSAQVAFQTGQAIEAHATASDQDDPNISSTASASLVDAADNILATDSSDSNRAYEMDLTTSTSAGTLDLRIVFTDKDGFISESEIIRIAFDAAVPGSNDSLPDSWEQDIVDADLTDGINHIDDVLPDDDFDQDGLSNVEEFLAGSDPTDYYNTGHETEKIPSIIIVSGNGQSGSSGVDLTESLDLMVTDQYGEPLAFAPIHLDGLSFSMNGGLKKTTDPNYEDPLNVRTDAAGLVSITIQP